MNRRSFAMPFAVLLLAGCSGATATPTSPQPSVPSATAVPSVDATPTAVPAPAATLRPTASLRWSFKTGGSIWGSAALAGGTVFIGSNDDNLYALDATTGTQKWKFATGGDVRSQAAIAGSDVIVSSDDGNLYALDSATGKEIWRADINNDLKRLALNDPSIAATYDFDFLTSSPVVSGGLVFAGSSDGSVYAVDAATGAVKWTFKTDDRIRATPTVSGGIVYIGSWDGYLYALKADTGALVWKYLAGEDVVLPKYLNLPIQSTATVVDGVVYCASRKANVFALDAKTGKAIWEYSNGAGNWMESSPVVRNGTVYIGSSAARTLFSLKATDGTVLNPISLGAYAWSTPLVTDEAVFIGTEGQPNAGNDVAGMRAIDTSGVVPTAERWSYPLAKTAEPARTNGVQSTPLLAGGVLYFGGLDGSVYALDV